MKKEVIISDKYIYLKEEDGWKKNHKNRLFFFSLSLSDYRETKLFWYITVMFPKRNIYIDLFNSSIISVVMEFFNLL